MADLFSGLKQCQNESCPNYIDEKIEEIKHEGKILCSKRCIPIMNLDLFIENMKGKFDKTELFMEIHKQFKLFEVMLNSLHEENLKRELVKQEETFQRIKLPEIYQISGESKEEIPMVENEENELTTSTSLFREEAKKEENLGVIVPKYHPYDVLIPIRISNYRHAHNEIIEFAAILFDTKKNKIENEFHRYVKPMKLTVTEEILFEKHHVKIEDLKQAQSFELVINEFHKFLKENGVLEKQFTLVFTRRFVIARVIMEVFNNHKLKPPSYFENYINLKHIFVVLLKSKRSHLLNTQIIKKKLQRSTPEHSIKTLKEMSSMLNLKYKEVFTNILDLLDNTVRIMQKFMEKGVPITNQYEFDSRIYFTGKGEGDMKDSEFNPFEDPNEGGKKENIFNPPKPKGEEKEEDMKASEIDFEFL